MVGARRVAEAETQQDWCFVTLFAEAQVRGKLLLGKTVGGLDLQLLCETRSWSSVAVDITPEHPEPMKGNPPNIIILKGCEASDVCHPEHYRTVHYTSEPSCEGFPRVPAASFPISVYNGVNIVRTANCMVGSTLAYEVCHRRGHAAVLQLPDSMFAQMARAHNCDGA